MAVDTRPFTVLPSLEQQAEQQACTDGNGHRLHGLVFHIFGRAFDTAVELAASLAGKPLGGVAYRTEFRHQLRMRLDQLIIRQTR